MHVDQLIQIIVTVALMQRLQLSKVTVVPFPPRANHADIDVTQVGVAVVTLTKRIEQFFHIMQIQAVIEIRHEGFAIGRPVPANAFFNQPIWNFAAAFRAICRHKTQRHHL